MINPRTLANLHARLQALENQVDFERRRLSAGNIDDVMDYQRVHHAYQRAAAELRDAVHIGKLPLRCA